MSTEWEGYPGIAHDFETLRLASSNMQTDNARLQRLVTFWEYCAALLFLAVLILAAFCPNPF